MDDQRKSNDNNFTLDELGDLLEAKCERRLIHLGGCSTLKTDERHIQRFLKQTGASALSGYKTMVDWTISTVLEVLLFEAMQEVSTTRSGAKVIENRLNEKASGLVREMQFRMVVMKG